jgi:hypothetical protein
VLAIEAVPGLPRLGKIQLCELFTHLLWNRAPRATARMISQGIAHRMPRKLGRVIRRRHGATGSPNP